MATDRLIRETDPPSGLLASPVPQVWDPTADNGQGAWTRVYGEHNATRVLIYGPNGQPISAVNRLPVDAAISGAVDVSDRANRVLGQATVSGTVDVSDRANRALGQVTLSGSIVSGLTVVQSETIFSGATRTASTTPEFRTPPTGARALLVVGVISTLTGTFGPNEGIRFRTVARPSATVVPGPNSGVMMQTSPTTTSNRQHLIYWGVTSEKGDADVGSPGQDALAVTGLPPRPGISFSIVISGTFGGGQGITCSMTAYWLG